MNKGLTEERLERLFDLLEEIGWQIAIPDSEEEIPGLIIGTPEYISLILSGEYDA